MTARDAIAQRLEIQRRHNPSMGGPDQRDYRNADDVLDGLAAHGFAVVDLPPGHHHVTVADDGTWHAVPMREVVASIVQSEFCAHVNPGRVHGEWHMDGERIEAPERVWVDAPVQGDDPEDGAE